MNSDNLQQLIDRHGAALALYARQWCHAPDDALQEALINLMRQDPAPDNPVAWLYTTVRRRAMNLARAEMRRSKHQQQAGQLREPWFVETQDDVDSAFDIQSFLGRLPRLEREILVARIWGERSFAEIAEIVDLPSSTVHRRYRRALSELERMIHEKEKMREGNESELHQS